MPKRKLPFPSTFRQRLVKLALASAGRTIEDLAKELGCTEENLIRWQSRVELDEGESSEPKANELVRLRHEIRTLTEERDYLKSVVKLARKQGSNEEF
jgi:transposase-like protein